MCRNIHTAGSKWGEAFNLPLEWISGWLEEGASDFWPCRPGGGAVLPNEDECRRGISCVSAISKKIAVKLFPKKARLPYVKLG